MSNLDKQLLLEDINQALAFIEDSKIYAKTHDNRPSSKILIN